MPRGNESPKNYKRGKGTLAELIRVALEAHKLGIRTCIPATVKTYDPATQKANVVLGILTERYTDDGTAPDLPKEINVPVKWQRTAGGYLTFPLKPNDTGHVVISDRSLEKWLISGAPTDPGLRHTHNPIDGIFEPGLHADTNPIIPPTSLTHAVLEGALIKVGVNAAQAAVLGTIFLSLYNDLVTKFNAHIHTTTATIGAGPTVGVISPPTGAPAQPMVAGTHTSNKVSVE